MEASARVTAVTCVIAVGTGRMDKEGSAAITEEDFETCLKLKDSTNDDTEGWEHMTTCTVAGCQAVIHRRERKVSNRGVSSRDFPTTVLECDKRIV